MPGTAPGLVCPLGDKVIYAVPGVPYEMREMLLGTVLPDLQRRAGVSAVIKSRTLRTWGQSESGLAEMLAGRLAELDETGNPTLAFLASGIEGLKVRITAKAPDEAAVNRILADEAARVIEILGDLVFGSDDDAMESVVIGLLRDQGLSLGVAESLTGGLVGARLNAVLNAGEVLRGAIACCADEVKFDLLGLPRGPVITEEAVASMARAACRILGSDVGLGITGVAGPAEEEGQPVGTVLVAVAIDGETEVHRVRLPGDREQLRQYAVISLLNLLRLRLIARMGS
jgi:nicotinamide-nucleotide amidase